jgi:hypothetical protein
MKKCPPGVFCIENYMIFFLTISLFIVCYMMYQSYSYNLGKPRTNDNTTIIVSERENTNSPWGLGLGLGLSYPYNNLMMARGDLMYNNLQPPLRDERYIISSEIGGGMPINVSTNVGAVDTSYRQVGILTPTNGHSKDGIMALMGRPIFTNRDKWQYYTISNQNNAIRLPVSKAGKSCTNEYGCDKLYTGDTVFIEGYNSVYGVTSYDNDTIRYIPFV